jgi:hypothetical protein
MSGLYFSMHTSALPLALFISVVETIRMLTVPMLASLVELTSAFLQNVLPLLLRLLKAHGVVHVLVNMIPNLRRQSVEHSAFVELLGPPVPLLGWDNGCGRDLDGWVDEVQRQDFAVSGSGRIGEFEREIAVLEDVGEDEKAAFGR